jgi:hypothetical protein
MINFLSIILIIISISNVVSDCVTYGECGPTPKENGVYNCKYLGPAKILPNHILTKFKEVCPHLYTGNETFTCCNAAQIERLFDAISIPRQLMTRCPACFYNFKALVCDFSCNPNQNEFLTIDKEQPFNRFLYEQNKLKELKDQENEDENEEEEENKEEEKPKPILEESNLNEANETEVMGITAYITNYFADEIYNACRYSIC